MSPLFLSACEPRPASVQWDWYEAMCKASASCNAESFERDFESVEACAQAYFDYWGPAADDCQVDHDAAEQCFEGLEAYADTCPDANPTGRSASRSGATAAEVGHSIPCQCSGWFEPSPPV